MPRVSPSLAALLLLSVITAGAAPTGPELAARLDHVIRPDRSFEVRLDITDLKDGKPTQQSALRVMARRIADGTRFDAVANCLAPVADQGKTVLTAAGEIWFLDPKAKHPTRLSAQHFRGHSFVSDTLATSFAADYNTEILGEETVQDAARHDVLCLHLKLKLKLPRAAQPDTVEFWMDKKLLQPIKSQVATAKGKALRTSYYAAYAKVFDELRPTRVLVVSNTERGRITDVKFADFKPAEWKDEMFTKEALAKIAKGELP